MSQEVIELAEVSPVLPPPKQGHGNSRLTNSGQGKLLPWSTAAAEPLWLQCFPPIHPSLCFLCLFCVSCRDTPSTASSGRWQPVPCEGRLWMASANHAGICLLGDRGLRCWWRWVVARVASMPTSSPFTASNSAQCSSRRMTPLTTWWWQAVQEHGAVGCQ